MAAPRAGRAMNGASAPEGAAGSREHATLLGLLAVAAAGWAAFLVLNAASGRAVSASIDLGLVLATLLLRALAARRPSSARFAAHAAAASSTTGLLAVAWISGGPDATASWYLVLVPLFAGAALGARGCVGWLIGASLAFVAACLAPRPWNEVVPGPVERALSGAGLAVMAAAFALVSRRNAERQIEAARAREQTIAEQARELERTRGELEDARDRALAASRAKTDFLATMSHELRTPLNGMLGLGTVLLGMRLDRQQSELVSTLVASAETQRRLLDDVLDLARIEAGRLELVHEPYALPEAIEDVVDLFSARSAEKSLLLAAVIDPELPLRVRGDGPRIRQVLSNLVGNAVKYTERGSVVVRARVLDAASALPRVEVAIEDTGPGIAPAALRVLFRPFERAQATRVVGGTGLGLVIARHLAQAMGGEIDVESAQGRGSTFRFSWPVALLEPARPPEPRGKVVLLDPEPIVREAFGATGSAVGVEAAASGDVADAVAFAREGEVRALVVSGATAQGALDLATRARAELAGACPPLVVAATPAELAIAHDAVATGRASAVTLKPIRRARLQRVLDDLVRPLAETPSTRPRRASVIRAVVIDDEPTNRKVAQLLLERFGWTVLCAASGVEALALLEAQRIDVALVDLHMPEMDGFELARRIVSRLPASQRPLMAALTASVLPEDREQAAAAGLQRLIAKPIVLGALESFVLEAERELQAAERPASVPSLRAPDDAPSAEAPPIVSTDTVSQLRAILGEQEAVELIEELLGNAARQLDAMKVAARDGDLATIEREAHRLAGSGGTVGAAGLSASARRVEAAARAGDAERSRVSVADLLDVFDRTVAGMRSVLTRTEGAGPDRA